MLERGAQWMWLGGGLSKPKGQVLGDYQIMKIDLPIWVKLERTRESWQNTSCHKSLLTEEVILREYVEECSEVEIATAIIS